MANATAAWTGKPVAFLVAFATILIWATIGRYLITATHCHEENKGACPSSKLNALATIVARFRLGDSDYFCLQTGGDCRPQKLTHASGRVADFCDTNIPLLTGSTAAAELYRLDVSAISASSREEAGTRWSVSERRDAKVIYLCPCRPHCLRSDNKPPATLIYTC
jgi:low affinity Fe/Cu permease